MDDPHKKARDADRDAAIEVVETAFADGQISRPDYDLRVERLLGAATLGEVRLLVQDLRPPAEEPPAADLAEQVAVRVGPPQANTNAIRMVLIVVAALVVLGAAVPLVIFASIDRDNAIDSGVVEADGQQVELTSAQGYDALVDLLEAKTGSTEVFNATLYPGYAVIEVPVDGQSQRSIGYYFDGEWQDWTGRGTAMQDRFDLSRIDGAVVEKLVRRAQRLVEDPSSSYILVNPLGREEAVCLSAYATNEYGETGYLDARCDGTVTRSLRPTLGGR